MIEPQPMRFFGGPHDILDVVLTPEHEKCMWCEEEIEYGDTGFVLDNYGPMDGSLQPTDSYYHQECFLRSIMGSANHIEGKCSCSNKELSVEDCDEPGLTKREAARAAVIAYKKKNPL